MKYLIYVYLAVLQTCFIQTAAAEESPEPSHEIPMLEQDFVNSINKFTKEQIIAQLGEPAKADDVKIKTTGRIVASIWQYHHINTAEDGSYYQTTELDFIDDKVVMVAFMNHDGAEGTENSQQYQVPLQ